MKQRNRGYATDFPQSIREAVSGLAWSLLLSQPEAYRALRDGNTQVAQHFFEHAYTHIQKLVTDNINYKPGRGMDRLIDGLGPKADHQRTLKRLRAEAEPRVGEVYPDRQKTFDEVIQGIFGRK